MNIYTFIIATLLGLAAHANALASSTHEHQPELDEPEHNHEHVEQQFSTIEEDLAAEVGIKTTQARSQTLSQSIIVYGKLTSAPEQLSHVRARYSGLIKSVEHSIGNKVQQGDILARVESNESLKTYSIDAPIDGTIIQRHANKGEVTQDQILFSIANFDTLWAELRIYPTRNALITQGQPVFIEVNGKRVEANIEHIVPAPDKPYLVARAKINNAQLGLSPGMFIGAEIIVNQIPVALAVEKTSIQTLEARKGVFVKTGNQYQFTPLVLGRMDKHFIEVISGLTQGQNYISENSYLMKADIEKSEAEHDH